MLDAIDAKYANDAPFLAWVKSVETLMAEWDGRYHNLPYTLPLEDSTGLACWHDCYSDGMAPQQAFESDQSHWEE